MHGDYIVYIDESGDHGLDKINPQYPIFVLSACIFEKSKYCSQVVPSFLDIKFKYWNHDMIVFHSREIRKAQNEFKILQNQEVRSAFMNDLNAAISAAGFTIISSVINKQNLKNKYVHPDNPYDIALTFCLERTFGFLHDRNRSNQDIVFVVEKRGAKEDQDLELVFRRVVQGQNYWNCRFPFDIIFADKKANSSGMQLADLVSFPIGRNYLNPLQPNAAYSIVQKKFRTSGRGQINGYGYKVFP